MAMRKQKPLSIKDKPNILAAVDWNPKRKRIDIANELGLPASTVNTVVSKWKEIEKNAMVFSGATKQARGARHGELEEALLKWFKQVQISGVNFDGSVLKEKALEVADLGIDDFTAYNGWISRFRARHGIAYRQANAKGFTTDEMVVQWYRLMWLPRQGASLMREIPNLLVLDSFRGHLTAKMKQGLRRSAPPCS
ncbi:hypothetical protein HPB49_019131 [Dermacentor silvarum]|uniref:Uncharacterized protein n=1 Tax=Dermacentor silvarum TaxID=543639 RepID=A0ACB8E1Z9_DERSI|nr:hypothetical protein HPB49_019131 [Dermacentor silvarum]